MKRIEWLLIIALVAVCTVCALALLDRPARPSLSTLNQFESLEKRTLTLEQAVEDMLRGPTDDYWPAVEATTKKPVGR